MPNTGILLDEMYSGLKPFLKILGWDVQSVEDANLKGVDDTVIVEYASQNDLIVVTQDQLIADLAKLKGVPCILIGLAEIAKIVDENLKRILKEA